MNYRDIKNDLASIARPRPLLMGLLKKDVQGQTLGSIWAGILADDKKTKQTYLADVLGEFVDRQRMIPDPIDSLCDVIQCEANARYWRGWERHQQELKVHLPFRQKTYEDNEWGRAYQLIAHLRSIPCEWRTKRQSITEQAMDEALAWVNGRSERPEWMGT